MLTGYARVSKGDDQSTALQLRALRDAGCTPVRREAGSGGRADRVQLQTMVARLQPGDVVIVWKLDRLSRSLKDLLRDAGTSAPPATSARATACAPT